MHSHQHYTFRGTFKAYGGLGYLESGGAGTIYISQNVSSGSDIDVNSISNGDSGLHRDLVVSNDGQEPKIEFLSTVGTDSGRTVAVLGSDSQYDFEKLTLESKSHVTFKPANNGSKINIGIISGDKTGLLHVTAGTPVNIKDASGSFGAAFRSYSGSDLGLPEGINILMGGPSLA